nr:RNA-directed DNA polymerase, eukaryota, reverse transcriptase zinc-binding domain protein [Tanacetum cinerariifolium]
MAACTGCKAGSFPFSYLGLPIGSNMSRIANWQILIDRFKARLSGWKANLLSIGGRLTLINSVLESLVTKAPRNFHGSNGQIPSLLLIKVIKAFHDNEADIDLGGCQTSGAWAKIMGTINHLHSSGIVPLRNIRN